MKKLLVLFAVLFAFVSCNKGLEADRESREIVLNVDNGLNIDVQTKASAVTSMPSSLYWGATTGSAGSESSKWAAASASVSSNKIATGKYQTYSPTAYNYYVANKTFSLSSGSMVITTDNATDVVVGRTGSSTSNTPSVQLNHIFARTRNFSLSAGSTGYTLSNVSWEIVGKSTINGTAGTYNVSTGAWTAASTKLTSYTSVSNSSDLYLIPGTYTLKCTYTATIGDGNYTRTETKYADVVLYAGKQHDFSGTISIPKPDSIQITVTLSGWSADTSTNASLTF